MNDLKIITPIVKTQSHETYTGTFDEKPKTAKELTEGYYELTESVELGENDKAGDLVYLYTDVNNRKEQINLITINGTWHLNEDEEISLKPVHDGPARIAALMTNVVIKQAEIVKQAQLIAYTPLLDHQQTPQPGTALATQETAIARKSTALETKKKIAGIRNEAMLAQHGAEITSKEMDKVLNMQKAIMRAMASSLQKQIKTVQQHLWTIGLYLGTDHEILQISQGQSAPVTEPIVIRQRVLNMDEEVADTIGGGIDCQRIDEFDRWVALPENLVKIIPETRGMVALHIRGAAKVYTNGGTVLDAYANTELNRANLTSTYFLARNGENLYRVFVNFRISSKLFPDQGSYDDYFMDGDKPLKPGSKEHIARMNDLDAECQNGQRKLLIMQGLLDHTEIFQPIPPVNVCMESELIKYVYDCGSAVIDDGRPSFSTWLREVNKSIDVGCRIVLNPIRKDYYEANYVRVYPTNSSLPNPKSIYTLTRMTNCGNEQHFSFPFDRNDTVYRRYERDSKAKTKGSYYITKDDDFVINIDGATVEELEYYKTHRESRKSYLSMIPLIEAAIECKKQEIEDETPFKLLIAGELKNRGLNHDQARIDELVSWWKFKNRRHRALLSNDVSALNMIIIKAQQDTKATLDHEALKQLALTTNPNALYVGLKTNFRLVVMEAVDNLFVNMITYEVKKSSIEHLSTVECLAPRPTKAWVSLHESEKWAEWPKGKNRNDFLSPDQWAAFVDEQALNGALVVTKAIENGKHCAYVLVNHKNRHEDEDETDQHKLIWKKHVTSKGKLEKLWSSYHYNYGELFGQYLWHDPAIMKIKIDHQAQVRLQKLKDASLHDLLYDKISSGMKIANERHVNYIKRKWIVEDHNPASLWDAHYEKNKDRINLVYDSYSLTNKAVELFNNGIMKFNVGELNSKLANYDLTITVPTNDEILANMDELKPLEYDVSKWKT